MVEFYNTCTMSLSFDDLQAIRTIVREEINPLESDVDMLKNDVKEIYLMLAEPDVSGEI